MQTIQNIYLPKIAASAVLSFYPMTEHDVLLERCGEFSAFNWKSGVYSSGANFTDECSKQVLREIQSGR